MCNYLATFGGKFIPSMFRIFFIFIAIFIFLWLCIIHVRYIRTMYCTNLQRRSCSTQNPLPFAMRHLPKKSTNPPPLPTFLLCKPRFVSSGDLGFNGAHDSTPTPHAAPASLRLGVRRWDHLPTMKKETHLPNYPPLMGYIYIHINIYIYIIYVCIYTSYIRVSTFLVNKIVFL